MCLNCTKTDGSNENDTSNDRKKIIIIIMISEIIITTTNTLEIELEVPGHSLHEETSRKCKNVK